MIERNSSTFGRWLDLAFAAAYGPHARLDPATQAALWRRSERAIAARVAVSGAREGALEAELVGATLVLRDRGEPLALPLARVGEFALHTADLEAPRHPALERPDALLERLGAALCEDPGARDRIRGELQDSVFNLAVAEASALARSRTLAAGARWPAPLDPENLVIDGHPWHPMCKTRLGLGLAGVLRHAPENLSQGTFTFVDVADPLVQRCGDHDGWTRLAPPAARGWARIPVHVAQVAALRRLLPERWGRTIVPAGVAPRSARALLSLRTVAVDDAALHLKLALAVVTTSARRTVSAMSVHNGPPLTRLLAEIQGRDPRTRGLVILGDRAAIGLRGDPFDDRAAHLGAILRSTPDRAAAEVHGDGHETWVSAALGERAPGSGRTFLAALAERHGSARGLLADYVDLLVPPLLRLLSAHGVALEAHLQNTLAIVGPRGLVGFVLRDLGGIRLHRPRLRAAGHTIDVAPGSFIVTDDLDEVRDKLAHTLFHAHLAALFRWSEEALGIPAAVGWAHVRAALDRHADEPDAAADRLALVADRVRSKALLRMRIDERISEYTYTRVDNVLAAPAVIAGADALLHAPPPPTRSP
ncbi:MAG: IucA/IucC family protein [Nannocystaceae bacterium]